eukprot:GHVL01024580.1.p1 GENE.GHVL01024580.1~~GHVL01024580.1.p1  ORF type:complete len:1721 (-),score=220.16 GHVL01024580.1:148-5289(-)
MIDNRLHLSTIIYDILEIYFHRKVITLDIYFIIGCLKIGYRNVYHINILLERIIACGITFYHSDKLTFLQEITRHIHIWEPRTRGLLKRVFDRMVIPSSLSLEIAIAVLKAGCACRFQNDRAFVICFNYLHSHTLEISNQQLIDVLAFVLVKENTVETSIIDVIKNRLSTFNLMELCQISNSLSNNNQLHLLSEDLFPVLLLKISLDNNLDYESLGYIAHNFSRLRNPECYRLLFTKCVQICSDKANRFSPISISLILWAYARGLGYYPSRRTDIHVVIPKEDLFMLNKLLKHLHNVYNMPDNLLYGCLRGTQMLLDNNATFLADSIVSESGNQIFPSTNDIFDRVKLNATKEEMIHLNYTSIDTQRKAQIGREHIYVLEDVSNTTRVVTDMWENMSIPRSNFLDASNVVDKLVYTKFYFSNPMRSGKFEQIIKDKSFKSNKEMIIDPRLVAATSGDPTNCIMIAWALSTFSMYIDSFLGEETKELAIRLSRVLAIRALITPEAINEQDISLASWIVSRHEQDTGFTSLEMQVISSVLTRTYPKHLYECYGDSFITVPEKSLNITTPVAVTYNDCERYRSVHEQLRRIEKVWPASAYVLESFSEDFVELDADSVFTGFPSFTYKYRSKSDDYIKSNFVDALRNTEKNEELADTVEPIINRAAETNTADFTEDGSVETLLEEIGGGQVEVAKQEFYMRRVGRYYKPMLKQMKIRELIVIMMSFSKGNIRWVYPYRLICDEILNRGRIWNMNSQDIVNLLSTLSKLKLVIPRIISAVLHISKYHVMYMSSKEVAICFSSLNQLRVLHKDFLVSLIRRCMCQLDENNENRPEFLEDALPALLECLAGYGMQVPLHSEFISKIVKLLLNADNLQHYSFNAISKILCVLTKLQIATPLFCKYACETLVTHVRYCNISTPIEFAHVVALIKSLNRQGYTDRRLYQVSKISLAKHCSSWMNATKKLSIARLLLRKNLLVHDMMTCLFDICADPRSKYSSKDKAMDLIYTTVCRFSWLDDRIIPSLQTAAMRLVNTCTSLQLVDLALVFSRTHQTALQFFYLVSCRVAREFDTLDKTHLATLVSCCARSKSYCAELAQRLASWLPAYCRRIQSDDLVSFIISAVNFKLNNKIVDLLLHEAVNRSDLGTMGIAGLLKIIVRIQMYMDTEGKPFSPPKERLKTMLIQRLMYEEDSVDSLVFDLGWRRSGKAVLNSFVRRIFSQLGGSIECFNLKRQDFTTLVRTVTFATSLTLPMCQTVFPISQFERLRYLRKWCTLYHTPRDISGSGFTVVQLEQAARDKDDITIKSIFRLLYGKSMECNLALTPNRLDETIQDLALSVRNRCCCHDVGIYDLLRLCQLMGHRGFSSKFPDVLIYVINRADQIINELDDSILTMLITVLCDLLNIIPAQLVTDCSEYAPGYTYWDYLWKTSILEKSEKYKIDIIKLLNEWRNKYYSPTFVQEQRKYVICDIAEFSNEQIISDETIVEKLGVSKIKEEMVTPNDLIRIHHKSFLKTIGEIERSNREAKKAEATKLIQQGFLRREFELLQKIHTLRSYSIRTRTDLNNYSIQTKKLSDMKVQLVRLVLGDYSSSPATLSRLLGFNQYAKQSIEVSLRMFHSFCFKMTPEDSVDCFISLMSEGVVDVKTSHAYAKRIEKNKIFFTEQDCRRLGAGMVEVVKSQQKACFDLEGDESIVDELANFLDPVRPIRSPDETRRLRERGRK